MNKAMLNRVEMNIIQMVIHVLIVPYYMIPEPILPDSLVPVNIRNPMVVLYLETVNYLRYADIIYVDYGVKVIRQYNPCE